jgi:hypothetical protein
MRYVSEFLPPLYSINANLNFCFLSLFSLSPLSPKGGKGGEKKQKKEILYCYIISPVNIHMISYIFWRQRKGVREYGLQTTNLF